MFDVRARSLLAILQSFPFDEPGVSRPFSARLREENGWNEGFTRRAMDEYRRFLVLAALAGHRVSPSPIVDEVWHLHLLDTRSYWNELCGKVLGFPLHHEPSRGDTDSASWPLPAVHRNPTNREEAPRNPTWKNNRGKRTVRGCDRKRVSAWFVLHVASPSLEPSSGDVAGYLAPGDVVPGVTLMNGIG